MISVTNGFSVKNKESENWNLDEFFSRGGGITTLDNRGNVIFEAVKVQTINTQNQKSVASKNMKLVTEKQERLRYQRPILIEFSKNYPIKNKWVEIATRLGEPSKSSNIIACFNGTSSILNKDYFDSVVSMINELVAEENKRLKDHPVVYAKIRKNGVNCIKKINLIIEQQPIIQDYFEKMGGGDCFRQLSIRINKESKRVIPKSKFDKILHCHSGIEKKDSWGLIVKSIKEIFEGN